MNSLKAIKVGIGVIIFLHGMHKFLEGNEELIKLGSDFSFLTGISFSPFFMGYIAVLIQTFGGLFIATGFLRKYALTAVLLALITAALVLIKRGEPFVHYSHPIALTMIIIGLLIHEIEVKSQNI